MGWRQVIVAAVLIPAAAVSCSAGGGGFLTTGRDGGDVTDGSAPQTEQEDDDAGLRDAGSKRDGSPKDASPHVEDPAVDEEDAAVVHDAGSPKDTGAHDTSIADSNAPASCVGFSESEPNDTAAAANAFPTFTTQAEYTACGSASATDSDFLEFWLAAGTGTYNLDWTGTIGWTLTVNGTTITYPGATQLPPVDTSHPYVVKITAAQPTQWSMKVSTN